MDNQNSYYDLTPHTDKYQINMMFAHWKKGTHTKKRVFDVYYRKNPFGNGYAVFAGIERFVNYINNLHFSDEFIHYLAEQEESYDPEFLEYLRTFKFTGTLLSVPEGCIVFPNEPVIQVYSTVNEGLLIETPILNFFNYQTLIATKASRIRQIAPNDVLLEFGTRRAQEADAAIWGARSAYIAGFDATSNLRAGMLFKIPTKGTHSHAWVQDANTELEAFQEFVKVIPDSASLLVDTYNTLKSGVPNAIKVALEMEQQGKKLKSIRLDSGDLAYLSIKAREMLDEAGLNYVKICASNDLDENIIMELKGQGAKIDIWGVGTQLITASDNPSLGGVYKVVAKEEDGVFIPTIKISGNPEKVTTPGYKKVYRIINRENGKAEADYIADVSENIQNTERLKLFDPVHTYQHKFVTNFDAIELMVPIFKDGEQVYQLPNIEEIRTYHTKQLDLFWGEYLRKTNPERYAVDLSELVWNTKMELIRQHQI